MDQHANISDLFLAAIEYGLPSAGVVIAAIFGSRRTKRAQQTGEFDEDEGVHKIQVPTPQGSSETKVITGVSLETADMLQTALNTIRDMQEASSANQRTIVKAEVERRAVQETRLDEQDEKIEELQTLLRGYRRHIVALHDTLDDIYDGIDSGQYPPLPPKLKRPPWLQNNNKEGQ